MRRNNYEQDFALRSELFFWRYIFLYLFFLFWRKKNTILNNYKNTITNTEPNKLFIYKYNTNEYTNIFVDIDINKIRPWMESCCTMTSAASACVFDFSSA